MPNSPSSDPKPLIATGLAAHKQGDLETARRIYQQVLRLWPEHPHALHLLGTLVDGEGRYAEAVRLIARALPALDHKANVHNNLANALRHNGDTGAARRHYDRALAIDPNYAKAHHNLGVLLAAPGAETDRVGAREHFRRAVALQPDLAESWLELARLSRQEGKLAAAAELYQKVLDLRPDEVAALVDLGALHQVNLAVAKAVPLLERACQLAPEMALAHFNLAQALAELGELGRAEALHRRVLELDPSAIHSRLAVAKAQRDRCEWDSWEADRAGFSVLDEQALDQAPAPFILNLYPVPMATHQAAARAYARRFVDRARELGGVVQERRAESKPQLRIGYLSADFRHHPVGHLSHGLFAELDRQRLEPFAYSLIPADDEITALVRAGCGLFRDCARWSDRAIARQIADDAVDVLVDLTGYTTYSRPAILALRPAPLQLQHMGYVNTMGAPFIDYQIVDHLVVGPDERPFFDENLIFMPNCLFPVTPLGAIAATAAVVTRQTEGLPADRLVLCSFNGPSKLDPPTFAAWMEILRRQPDAVLWLFDGDEPQLPGNLRRLANDHGVEPARLFFSGKVPYPVHLQRYLLADLFLDAFTYNGGATAVDALRQGLPVLTKLGDAPLGRMGASVVTAAGLGQLVTTSATEYVELAVALLADRGRLRALTSQLTAAPPGRGASASSSTSALFDLARWTRHYEAGVAAAWEAAAQGRHVDINVADLDVAG